jgi:hypothetical protein
MPIEGPQSYSIQLFCAAVGLLFAPLAPLVALAAAFVFWSTSWVFKYQLMYIFVTQAETGGVGGMSLRNNEISLPFYSSCGMLLSTVY